MGANSRGYGSEGGNTDDGGGRMVEAEVTPRAAQRGAARRDATRRRDEKPTYGCDKEDNFNGGRGKIVGEGTKDPHRRP